MTPPWGEPHPSLDYLWFKAHGNPFRSHLYLVGIPMLRPLRSLCGFITVIEGDAMDRVENGDCDLCQLAYQKKVIAFMVEP